MSITVNGTDMNNVSVNGNGLNCVTVNGNPVWFKATTRYCARPGESPGDR